MNQSSNHPTVKKLRTVESLGLTVALDSRRKLWKSRDEHSSQVPMPRFKGGALGAEVCQIRSEVLAQNIRTERWRAFHTVE